MKQGERRRKRVETKGDGTLHGYRLLCVIVRTNGKTEIQISNALSVLWSSPLLIWQLTAHSLLAIISILAPTTATFSSLLSRSCFLSTHIFTVCLTAPIHIFRRGRKKKRKIHVVYLSEYLWWRSLLKHLWLDPVLLSWTDESLVIIARLHTLKTNYNPYYILHVKQNKRVWDLQSLSPAVSHLFFQKTVLAAKVRFETSIYRHERHIASHS